MLQWSRDLSTTEIMFVCRAWQPMNSFNGAVIFRPRKSANLTGTGLVGHVLQWSRDLSTTEIQRRGADALLQGRLQWSRDLSTTEIIPATLRFLFSQTLQWSRDLSTTEIPVASRARRCSHRAASMEP